MNLRPHPHDTQAEQALIAAVLENEDLLDDPTTSVSTDDFYHPTHRIIWAACIDVIMIPKPLDPITLGDRLRARGQYDTIGGTSALTRIYRTPYTANPAQYADIIRQNAARRNIVVKARNLARMAADYTCDKQQMEGVVEELNREVGRLGYGGTDEPGDVVAPRAQADALTGGSRHE